MEKLVIDLKKARRLFRAWHKDEYVSERKMSDYADRLIARLKAECTADAGVWVVVQEGGSSGEIYCHGFDSEAEAQRHKKSCEKASYNVLAIERV